jgi:hypothetical protein
MDCHASSCPRRKLVHRTRWKAYIGDSVEVNFSKSSIRSLFLPGPAGRLEALLNTGSASPAYAAVVAHPHPLFGGTMHNKVVYHAAKALNEFGFPVLRFNFRGVGGSQGEHDNGRGEVDDVRAALAWMAGEFRLPIIFAGFSFGAATGLRAICGEASTPANVTAQGPVPQLPSAGEPWRSVQALILLGLPLRAEDRQYQYDCLRESAEEDAKIAPAAVRPKLFVSGEGDQYASTKALAELVAGFPGANRLITITGADHFFTGHLSDMRAAIKAWVEETLLGGGVAV